MSRPCTCNRVLENTPYDTTQCRLCWLYHNDPKYREAWDKSTEEGQITSPSFLQKAVGFGQSVAKHVANGLKAVTAEEYDKRLAICRGEGENENCPHYLDSYKGGRCAKCGCGLAGAVFAKAKWASEHCPIGKW